MSECTKCGGKGYVETQCTLATCRECMERWHARHATPAPAEPKLPGLPAHIAHINGRYWIDTPQGWQQTVVDTISPDDLEAIARDLRTIKPATGDTL